MEDQELLFENNPEFLNDSIIFCPDLSLTNWRIKRGGIQPNDEVNSGRLEEKGLHIKNTVIDYRQNILENSFWVSFSKNITAEQLKDLNKGYILIAGTYDMK